MPNDDARNFVIWVHQVLFPQAAEYGHLTHGRLTRILSHKDPDTECFALQFDVDSTARLHHWYKHHGQALDEELGKLFEKRVLSFSTLMEEIDGI